MDKRILIELENQNLLVKKLHIDNKSKLVTLDKEVKHSEFIVVNPGGTKCQVNEKIYTLKNRGTDIKLGDEDYTIINFAEVLMRVTPE